MSVDYQLLGKRIKTQRIIKGKTQEHFAEQMEVSVGYISQLERGITKMSLDRLASISTYLECEMSFLLEGININSNSYLDKEFNEVYSKLTKEEKKMLTLLVKEYINNKGFLFNGRI